MGEFADYVVDMLAPLGPVRPRRMFGGTGIFCGDVMFAMIFDDVLYLRTDADNRPAFEAAGLPAFIYTGRSGKAVTMPYHSAPADALEDADMLRDWGRAALAAAYRAR